MRPAQREPDTTDPTVARASPRQWLRWTRDRASHGRRELATGGAILVAAFLGAILALAAFVSLTDDVLESETRQWDLSGLAWLHQFASPGLTSAALGVSALGQQLIFAFVLGLLLWCGLQRRWGAAVALVVTVGGAQLLNDVIKQVVHRSRPIPVGAVIFGQSYSFPSGHAMVSMAFYGFVAYLGWRLLRARGRILWVAGLAFVILLIGLARLYLEVHYPTDVIGGYLAGFVWLDAVLLAGHVLGRGPASRRQTHALPHKRAALPAPLKRAS
jgi:undecaprenyl-diphosphatase